MHFYSFNFEYKSCARVAPYTKRTLSDRQGITQNCKYDWMLIYVLRVQKFHEFCCLQQIFVYFINHGLIW